MLRNIIWLATFVLLIQSCKQPEEEPEFKYVHNVKVNKVTGEEVLLSAEAVFYNPNDMRMKLRAVDVDVFVSDKKVGKIEQDLKTTIPALEEFTVPFKATFNIKEMGVMNTLLGLIGGQKFPVKYDGHIKVSVYGIPFRVPVEYEDEVRFRM